MLAMAEDLQSATIDLEEDTNETRNALVLVVDDDTLVHKLVKKILDRGEFSYAGVNSANEALDFLEDKVPDLILTDIMMPDINGIELCEKIRFDDRFNQLPIIFLTGLSDMDTLSRAYAAGANDYVVKPLRQVEVISRVKHHINEYRRKRESDQKIQKLNRQNESKTKFLGVASHDLRNPLVSIRGISQYLQSEQFGTLTEGQKELVGTITQASEFMLNLVEDLLDVSMFETGQIRISPKYESLQGLVEMATTLHSASASKKQIQIDFIPKTDNSLVNIDRKLISRVIDNLITNALKFSPSETKVQLILDSDDKEVWLAIEDEGPGIPEDEFDKLFKEFGRTSNQPTGGESSSGIGLYISKRIIKEHGGDITVENRPEGGARFTIKLHRVEK